MRVNTILAFIALIGIAAAASFTKCATDHLGITSITLSETPIVPGTTLTITAKGKPDQAVSSGSLKMGILLLNQEIRSTTYDLCKDVGLTCPLKSGTAFTAVFKSAIASDTPSVSVTLEITAFDGSNKQLTCIDVPVTVSSSKPAILSDIAAEYLLKSSFEQYKKDFNKIYAPEEEEIKFFHFKNSVERVAWRNANLENIYGLTKFSDMCPEEFKKMYLNYIPVGPQLHVKTITPGTTTSSAFDWRSKNAVTAVKDQKQCGSCWAFSVAETIESAWYLAGNTLTAFSEQQIVSCDKTDAGCNGGNPPTAYDYVESAGGLATESAYPYVSGTGDVPECANFTVAGGKISGYSYATDPCYLTCKSQDEDKLVQTVATVAPPSICVDASTWSDYKEGVMTSASCSSSYFKLDHCVHLVGYSGYTGSASSSTNGYYIVRNSWNTDWGVAGYIYLAMGTNTCGIADEATVVTIAK